MARFQMSLWNRDGFLFLRAKDDLLGQPQDLTSADIDGDLLKADSVQRWPLGSRIHDISGDRSFIYAGAGAGALVTGQLVQSPVPSVNHEDMAVQAPVNVGDTTIKFTNVTDAIAANDYAGGLVVINQGAAGLGDVYRIKSNDAGLDTQTVTLTLHDKVRRALATATHKVALIKPPTKGVIVHPSPPTALVIGVPLVEVPANSFFWAQTWGLGPALADTTLVINDAITASPNINGAVSPVAAFTNSPIGIVAKVGDNTDYAFVYWRISR